MVRRLSPKTLRLLSRLRRNTRGTAAIETALIAMTLVTLFMNAVEIARYYYIKMELQNATQMAAYQVFQTCNTPAELPATQGTNCAWIAAVDRGKWSTSLGANVSTPTVTENYYCTSTAGVLTSVGPITAARPANCGSVGNVADTPGDYIRITGQYTYAPLFSGVTVGSAIPTTMQTTTMMRLQ